MFTGDHCITNLGPQRCRFELLFNLVKGTSTSKGTLKERKQFFFSSTQNMTNVNFTSHQSAITNSHL